LKYQSKPEKDSPNNRKIQESSLIAHKKVWLGSFVETDRLGATHLLAALSMWTRMEHHSAAAKKNPARWPGEDTLFDVT
jgi:hypothetical protein